MAKFITKEDIKQHLLKTFPSCTLTRFDSFWKCCLSAKLTFASTSLAQASKMYVLYEYMSDIDYSPEPLKSTTTVVPTIRIITPQVKVYLLKYDGNGKLLGYFAEPTVLSTPDFTWVESLSAAKAFTLATEADIFLFSQTMLSIHNSGVLNLGIKTVVGTDFQLVS